MTPEDTRILFRVAQWIGDGNRKVMKMIRQLAETEENYLIIIRENDRVAAQLSRARLLGADATLTLVEWLVTLEDFDWRCAYCQSKPFQVMSHVIPYPQGGTTSDNCVPACYGCITAKNNEFNRARVRAYIAYNKNKIERIRIHDSASPPLSSERREG